ncbi:MAG: PAS domain S-box protein [Deltaproteobacteria bacterium]|nr:PAS domain S-box protein [Deltaproteobacteria bacterium]
MSVLKNTIATSETLAFFVLSDAVLAAYYGAGPMSTLFALVLSGAAALLVFLLIKRVVLPLSEAETFVKRMTEGDFSANLKLKSKDLGELTEDINKLAGLLRESEARQKDLISTIPCAVIQLDNSGSVVYLNEPALALTGYSAMEAAGLDYTDFTPQGSHHEMKEAIKAVIGGNAVSDREMHILGKDSREVAFEFSAMPLWKGRQPHGCLLIGRDVDEKKKIEDELKIARFKMQEAAVKLNKTIQCLEEFSLMAVRRELKMQEIRERLMELKKDTGLKKEPLDRTA